MRITWMLCSGSISLLLTFFFPLAHTVPGVLAVQYHLCLCVSCIISVIECICMLKVLTFSVTGFTGGVTAIEALVLEDAEIGMVRLH